MPIAPSFAPAIAPRIYYLFPAPTGASSNLTEHLKRCRQMGFTHIMRAVNPSLGSETVDGLDTASDSAASNGLSIAALARVCHEQNLLLLLDIDFSAGMSKKPNRERQGGEVLPDPRHVGHTKTNEPDSADMQAGSSADSLPAPATWEKRLEHWINAGVAGFCCRSLPSRSTQFWHSTIGRAKSIQPTTVFIAWTPGCTSAQVTALSHCGFDATVASTAWWDYSAKWLEEESVRLMQVPPDCNGRRSARCATPSFPA